MANSKLDYLGWFKLGVVIYGIFYLVYVILITLLISLIANTDLFKIFNELPGIAQIGAAIGIASLFFIGIIAVIIGGIMIVISRWIASKIKYKIGNVLFKTLFIEKMIWVLLSLTLPLPVAVMLLIIGIISALIASLIKMYIIIWVYKKLRWKLPY